MCRDIGRASGTLVGVGEAHLENVAVSTGHAFAVRIDDRGAGAGRSDGESLVFLIKRGDCCAGSGCDGCQRDLHAAVLQSAVSSSSFFCIVLVIFKLERELDAALCVDFFNCHLCSNFNSIAVYSRGAGQRTAAADFDGAVSSCSALGCSCCRIGTAAACRAAATGCEGHCHACSHGNCQSCFPKLFHNVIPPD